jgi:heme/copper-type cytochrome/quinol oxidase subunit 2
VAVILSMDQRNAPWATLARTAMISVRLYIFFSLSIVLLIVLVVVVVFVVVGVKELGRIKGTSSDKQRSKRQWILPCKISEYKRVTVGEAQKVLQQQ